MGTALKQLSFKLISLRRSSEFSFVLLSLLSHQLTLFSPFSTFLRRLPLLLAERVEYLTLAVSNAKSSGSSSRSAGPSVEFLTDLEEKLEVAQVQLEVARTVYEHVDMDQNLKDDLQAKLDSRLMTISEVSVEHQYLVSFGGEEASRADLSSFRIRRSCSSTLTSPNPSRCSRSSCSSCIRRIIGTQLWFPRLGERFSRGVSPVAFRSFRTLPLTLLFPSPSRIFPQPIRKLQRTQTNLTLLLLSSFLSVDGSSPRKLPSLSVRSSFSFQRRSFLALSS